MKVSGPVGEQDQQDCRRQSKAGPCRGGAEIAGAHEADRKPDLAGRRAGQKLTKRYEVGIGPLVEPAPAHDELITEISDVRDRPAEAAYSKFEENEQNFDRRAYPLGDSHRSTIIRANVFGNLSHVSSNRNSRWNDRDKKEAPPQGRRC